MKKILLISVFVSISLILCSQSRILLPKELNNVNVKMDFTSSGSKTMEYNQPTEADSRASFLAPDEHLVGTTFYDMQAYNSLHNRIYRYADGSIGAVWTRSMNEAGFPDMGTGYNFYDGTDWGPLPLSRIETIKTGWPSYAPLGSDGEIVLSHHYASGQIIFSTRDIKGVGNWTDNLYTYSSGPPVLACPRMITSGTDHNTIHLMAYADNYMGQNGGIVYSRSQDGGISWDIENVVLEGTGAAYYTQIMPDQYVLAERAGTIALLCGSAWMDLFMLKSTDNGDSWEKTVIWEHPYPLFNGGYNTNPFFSTDNSANIALDSEGKAHVVFGINRVRYENGYYFYPYIDGIGYWNEDMDPFSSDIDALAPPGTGYPNSEMIEDYNYIGWMQDVDGDGVITLNSGIKSYRQIGPSTIPTITVDDLDHVFVLFSSTTETYEIGTYNYKHILARGFADGSWGPFIDLSDDIIHSQDECFFPVLASSSDDYIHYFYNADDTPGLAVDYDHPYQENLLIYGALPKIELVPQVGVEENYAIGNDHLVVHNYPNPFSTATTLSYILEKPSLVTIRIINAEGQLIDEISNNQPGGEQQFLWNAEKFPAGVYYYRITTGDQVGSGKMILMK